MLSNNLTHTSLVQHWGTTMGGARYKDPVSLDRVTLGRVTYYDAWPDEEPQTELLEYWRQVEELPDTAVGFGALRGRPRRQKRVDGLIAVDMMVGAFTGLFQIAILLAADADFVPVVEEVRRRGVMVVVVAVPRALAVELRHAADRVWELDPQVATEFPPLTQADGRQWFEDEEGRLVVRSVS
jgi:uncharacterized LabA/DUF88 family protein